MKDILDEKYDFIDQSKLNLKNKVNISFLELLNIISCIQKEKNLNTCHHLSQNMAMANCIQVKKKCYPFTIIDNQSDH